MLQNIIGLIIKLNVTNFLVYYLIKLKKKTGKSDGI